MKAQYLCLKKPEISFNQRIFRLITCVVLGLLLQSCGNKGDLYLPELSLSEEQKNMLDELDSELNNGVDEDPDRGTSNTSQQPAGVPQNELTTDPLLASPAVKSPDPAAEPASKKKKTTNP